jgi:hypothetical protein
MWPNNGSWNSNNFQNGFSQEGFMSSPFVPADGFPGRHSYCSNQPNQYAEDAEVDFDNSNGRFNAESGNKFAVSNQYANPTGQVGRYTL